MRKEETIYEKQLKLNKQAQSFTDLANTIDKLTDLPYGFKVVVLESGKYVLQLNGEDVYTNKSPDAVYKYAWKVYKLGKELISQEFNLWQPIKFCQPNAKMVYCLDNNKIEGPVYAFSDVFTRNSNAFYADASLAKFDKNGNQVPKKHIPTLSKSVEQDIFADIVWEKTVPYLTTGIDYGDDDYMDAYNDEGR